MLYYSLKVLLSAFIIATVSELAKRSSVLGAMLASLPLTSLLAFVWLYVDTGDAQKVSSLSLDIFWLVLPSLPLFLLLPFLISRGWGFWLSLLAAALLTACCYGIMLLVKSQIQS